MATETVDIVGLAVDSRSIKKGRAELDKLGTQAKKTERATDGLATSSKRAATAIAAMAVAAAAFAAVKLIEVAREFDIINASLITVTGSVENAALAFDRIQEFAATTPFALKEVADAFIKLKALGLDPSERALLSYGNTASAMGKSLNQMIEAVADAATGEFERLKEFGIKAKSQGDNVSFTFRGITTTVEKEANAIQDFLLRIGETDFAGAMEERANSLDGALSNLDDSWDNLFLTMSQAGVGNIVEGNARQATAALQDMAKWIEDNTILIGKMADVFSNAASGIAFPFEAVGSAIGTLAAQMVAVSEGEFKQAFTIGKVFIDDMTKSLEEMTDPEISSKYENIARSVIAANKKMAESSAGGGTSVDGERAKLEAQKKADFLRDQNEMFRDMAEQNNIDRIDAEANYFIELNELAEMQRLTEEERELARFEVELQRIEDHRVFLEENNEFDMEAEAVFNQAKEDAEFLHQQQLQGIRNKAITIEIAAAQAAAKLMKLIDKGNYLDSISMMLDFAVKSGALNEAQFEAVKKVQMGIAIIKGLGTIMNAIEHGSQTAGIYGAIIEGAIATAMVASQISAISSASMGGGSISSSPGGSPGGIQSQQIPEIQQQATAEQQAPSLSITVNAPEGLVDPIAAQALADSLMPFLEDSQRRGLGGVA